MAMVQGAMAVFMVVKGVIMDALVLVVAVVEPAPLVNMPLRTAVSVHMVNMVFLFLCMFFNPAMAMIHVMMMSGIVCTLHTHTSGDDDKANQIKAK